TASPYRTRKPCMKRRFKRSNAPWSRPARNKSLLSIFNRGRRPTFESYVFGPRTGWRFDSSIWDDIGKGSSTWIERYKCRKDHWQRSGLVIVERTVGYKWWHQSFRESQ
ncbi:unnamed protein product, partial [Nesidiocoris tenuis]